MKIRRYVARDMRSALAQIKEELGPDAVIMSNKKIAEGVELMAAVDYNQSVKPAKVGSEKVGSEKVAAEKNQLNEGVQFNNRLDASQDTVSLTSNVQTLNQKVDAPADSLAALLNRQVQQSGYDKTPATRAFDSQIANSSIEFNQSAGDTISSGQH